MVVSVHDPADDIKRLQRCINDLVSILALPAIWTGGEPSQIVRTLMESLVSMLRLDFVYLRLNSAIDGVPAETISVAQSLEISSQEIVEQLQRSEVEQEKFLQIGAIEFSIAPIQLGLQGQIGRIVAGATRKDFPQDTEELILGVAANQAAIGLREAQLLSEQKRLASELDRRVKDRTREFESANEELQREIAEHKLSEEALAAARVGLAKVTRITSLGVLTASIAHEINQPLSGIITNASTCLRMLSAEPPNVDGAMETARRAIRDGNRASEVVTRLRALYGKKDIEIESMDLNDAVREVVSLALGELRANRVTLRSELAKGLPLINGDRVQLQQVILNLLRNASDAMSGVNDRPRELLVRTMLDDENQVCVAVQDSGTGFSPEDGKRLFEAFYTTKDDGMGIGLSVSKSIIEAHNGRLWASVNNGCGSTFAFSIPTATPGVP